jgi:hypothetical protein
LHKIHHNIHRGSTRYSLLFEVEEAAYNRCDARRCYQRQP